MGSSTVAIASTISLSDLDDTTITLNGSNKVAIKDGGVGATQISGGAVGLSLLDTDNLSVLTTFTLASTVVLYDSFTDYGTKSRTDMYLKASGTTGVTTLLQAPSWTQASGEIYADGNSLWIENNGIAEISHDMTAGTWQWVVDWSNKNDAGGGLRTKIMYADESNHYQVEMNNTSSETFKLQRRQSASTTDLISSAYTFPSSETAVKVTRSGSSWELFNNGSSVGTTTSSFTPATPRFFRFPNEGTTINVGIKSVQFDNTVV